MPDLVFGLVPYPAVIASHLPLSNPYVKHGAPSIPEAVFLHRMIGNWQGTDGWFHGGNGATAYGVAVAAMDGANAGSIYEWISRESGYYGESSGPAVGPYGDGLKLIEQVGVGNVNRLSKAIEISGNYDTPLDEPAREAIVNLTAYFADQRKIPWDQFPIVPGTDRSFVCWHSEITGDAYKLCPGAVVRNETSALIARVAQRLKEYQTDSTVQKPPTYAAPQLPEWFARSLEQSRPSDAKDGDVLWRVVRRNVEALKRTQRYSEPSTKAKRSGPPVEVREKVFVERTFTLPETGANGKVKQRQWFVTGEGHYVPASSFTPRVVIQGR